MMMISDMLGLSAEGGSAVREGAGFWVRALARGIDTVVHLVVGLVAGLSAGVLAGVGAVLLSAPVEPVIEKLSATTPLGLIAALAGGMAMHALSEGLHGSTIGKRLCGLTVISEDGSPANLLACLKRSVAFLWDALFFGLVAAQKMSESPRRQRFGDVWGGTQVVRLSSLDPGARRSWVRFAAAAAAALFVDGAIMLVELGIRLA